MKAYLDGLCMACKLPADCCECDRPACGADLAIGNPKSHYMSAKDVYETYYGPNGENLK